jgi:hypothetical protein
MVIVGLSHSSSHRRQAARQRQLREPGPVRTEQRALHQDQCLGMPLGGCLEGPCELVGTTRLQGE